MIGVKGSELNIMPKTGLNNTKDKHEKKRLMVENYNGKLVELVLTV